MITASQIGTTPVMASGISVNTMPMEMNTFWRTIARDARLIPTANGRRIRSSDISATSAASSATSVPLLPMAMPTVAAASAGASFTPSPTMAMAPCLAWSSRTSSILRSGISDACTSSTPTSRPTALPTAGLSPVSITTGRTPSACSVAMASAASGRGPSIMPMAPVKWPSTATSMAVHASCSSEAIAARASAVAAGGPPAVPGAVPSPSKSRSAPRWTRLPSTMPDMPLPRIACVSCAGA